MEDKLLFFTDYKCPFCLKMDFAVLLKNLSLPVQDEIEIIWDGSGDPREQKLIETFGRLVPLPVLMKDGEVREVVSGVYGNIEDKFDLNLEDNFILIDSLIKEGGL